MAYINLLEIIYPVGSMWISSINTSPAEIVGGSWTRIEDARFLMAGNGTRKAGEAGGANTITLTTNQIPAHSHSINAENSGSGGSIIFADGSDTSVYNIQLNKYTAGNVRRARQFYGVNNTGGGSHIQTSLLITLCICGYELPNKLVG